MEGTKEFYFDKIYHQIEKAIIDNPGEIIENNAIKLKLDDEELIGFFQENGDYVISTLLLRCTKLINEYNLPINTDDLSVILDTTYFPQSKFRELKGRNAYKVVCLNAVVVGEDSIKFYMKKRAYRCETCGSRSKVRSEEDIREGIICSACKKSRKLVTEECEFGEIKSLIIREDFEEANDKQPIEYLAKVKDSLIHKFHIGQKIRLVGIRKAVLEPKKDEYHIEIDILSAESLEDPKEVLPTEEEIKSFRLMSKNLDFEKKLVDSFAPDVHCAIESALWNVKKTILLMLATGKKLDRKRQYMHLLLLGDPSTAKTTMMKYAASITPHSLYVAGNSSSKAGLTAIVEKQIDGRYIVKAGVLPLCNNGFCMVDEFNLMEPEDQNGLQEAMENQIVTKAKAAIAQFPAKCGIIGGANPVYGKYDEDRTVLENLNISVPLLSRFDVKWCLLDRPEASQDTAITKLLLKYHKSSEKVDNEVPFNKDQMRKYLNYIRTLEPDLTTDAEEAIINFVNKVRALNKGQKSMPIDKRIIETTIRLSVSKAKIMMKDFVDVKDVNDVTNLYLKSLESFGIDTKSDLIQDKFFDKKEMNQDQTFWQCFSECMDKEGAVDMVQLIDKLSCTKSFDEYKAKAYFERMVVKHKLYELKSGKWKKVD